MEKFLSNQIIRQLNLLYNLKIISQTLPQVSTKVFGIITSQPPTPLMRKQKDPQKTIQLGYPSFFTKTTGKRLFFLDVNSLYPFCFVNKFPSKTSTSDPPKFTITLKATVIAPNFSRISHPLLSNESVNTFYTPQEINHLTKLGYTFEIIDQLRLPYKTDLFTDFIIHLFSRKKNHPRLIKHLLNSFYGKLISSENSSITSLTLQYMLSYSRTYTHMMMSDKTNTSFYTDTDSLTLQHPLKFKTSQKLGLYKNSISQSKFGIVDHIYITSPRNYRFATKNKRETKNIGNDHNLSHTESSNRKSMTINNKEVNSISTVEFIYN